MKTTRFVIASILVCAAVLMLIARSCHKSLQKPIGESVESQNNSRSNSVLQPISGRETIQTSNKIENVLQQKMQTTTSRVERFKAALESKNVPIEFYGQVIDQNSNAISDIKINISIRHWELSEKAESRIIRLQTETDAEGRFKIIGGTGDAFDINLLKNGYELSSKSPRSFGPKGGSFEIPVVFKMWKLGASEKISSFSTLFGFQPDGRIYTLNLITNKKTEGQNTDGDLQVRFERQSSVKPRDLYPWTLEITAVGGGLIETTDEFKYVAPESGYEPQIIFQMDTNNTNWVTSMTKDYYIKTRNGQAYGAIHLQIHANYNGQSAIYIDSSVNPNGSRNLHP